MLSILSQLAFNSNCSSCCCLQNIPMHTHSRPLLLILILALVSCCIYFPKYKNVRVGTAAAAFVYRTLQCTLTESSFTPIHRKPTNSWRGWRPFPKFVLHRFYQNLLNPPPAPPPPVSPVPPAPTQKIQTTSPRTQFGSCIERKL